jgi:RHS repeat-associated protein
MQRLGGNTSAQVNPAIGGLPAETLYFGYNSFEKPSSIATSTSDTIAGATQYNHLDQIATFQQYDKNVNSSIVDTTGLTQTYFSWDATTGRLANQSATNIAKGVTADLGKTSYTYTPSGKLTARELSYANRPGAPVDYQCYNYDYPSRLAAVWTPAAKNCSAAPAPSATSVPGLGGPAPYAQTYTYTAAGDRSQVKRFDAAGALAATENYTYPTAGQPGAHRLQSMTSTPSAGAATNSSFTWDTAGRMTGRAGETLTYTLDGLISTTAGASNLKTNSNPSAAAGTPPAPAAGTAGSAGTRYYDATGNLVALIDGSGTTAVLGPANAHATPTGVKTATRTYSFSGKTVAQRTAANGAVKLMFLLSDTVNTAQTIVQATNGTTLATAITRFTDPAGLARGPTQSATGAGAYSTAPTATTGVGSNAANPAGFGALNGYIAGPSDTVSALTHLGARDLDPVLGSFTAPDPVLHTDDAGGFTPYAYSANDPINHSDPSGLDWWGDVGNWFHDNAGTIANVATAIVVSAAVFTVASACVASVVCGIGVAIAAGAIGATAGYIAGNAVDVAVGK